MAGNNGDILRPAADPLQLTMGNAHNYEHLGQPAVWPEAYVDNNPEKFEGGDNSWVQMPQEAEKGAGKKPFNAQHEYLNNDYLKRKPTEQFKTKQGLSETTFHNGFYRRPAHKIQIFEEGKFEKEAARMQLREKRTDFRREELRAKYCRRGASNGILTGNYDDAASHRARGRRNFRNVLSKETQIEGQIKLRQSSSRFHMPYSDWNYDNRRKNLGNEGVLAARKSSELGIGRGDLPSNGTADNFSKSYYLKQARDEAKGQYVPSLRYTQRSANAGGNSRGGTARSRNASSRQATARQQEIAAVSALPK
mgnify:CR=1 FL=1|jgi:hypothetical protein